MSLSQVQPEHYDEQLKQKATQIRERFSEWYQGKLAVHSSPPSHYRMRAEFRIWREHGTLHYAMQDPATRQPVFITHFPVACERINALMVSLMQALQSNPVLQHKLFQVEFHATTTNDALVTLVYHRRLDDLWETAARTLETELDAVVIGRSRGQKVVLSREFVTESFCIDGKTITQRQPESAFSQPNAAINKQMLQWGLVTMPATRQRPTGAVLRQRQLYPAAFTSLQKRTCY
jgi:tRNA (uracil-5-)-methyltransferase